MARAAPGVEDKPAATMAAAAMEATEARLGATEKAEAMEAAAEATAAMGRPERRGQSHHNRTMWVSTASGTLQSK